MEDPTFIGPQLGPPAGTASLNGEPIGGVSGIPNRLAESPPPLMMKPGMRGVRFAGAEFYANALLVIPVDSFSPLLDQFVAAVDRLEKNRLIADMLGRNETVPIYVSGDKMELFHKGFERMQEGHNWYFVRSPSMINLGGFDFKAVLKK
ncbi:MAG: hypothetical protein QOG91_662 [Candidatus Parcubacteria bacterium]|jgi:hypothetical protein|nr:hypothetical protein [Candidatus Parcubacteria bacterium]